MERVGNSRSEAPFAMTRIEMEAPNLNQEWLGGRLGPGADVKV